MMLSQVQDSVVGGYLMTRDSISMDDVFVSRIHANSELFLNEFRFFKDGSKQISGK